MSASLPPDGLGASVGRLAPRLLELTWDGPPALGPDGKPKSRKQIQLPTGESRTFLADGDEIIMRAWCEREGFRRIGFGECRGRVLPAL